MAARKKKTTRSKNKKKQFSLLAPITVVGLIGIATAGWYISLNKKPTLRTTVTAFQVAPSKKASHIIAPTPKVSSPTRQSAERNVMRRPPLPLTAQMPVQKQVVMAIPSNKTASITPPSYMEDSHLPPAGRFNTQNAANMIFAKRKTVIYAVANAASPQIAVVERGQEMRSYEKQGSWHHITVPRTGIIGWVQDDSLTSWQATSKPSLDYNKTGAISKPR